MCRRNEVHEEDGQKGERKLKWKVRRKDLLYFCGWKEGRNTDEWMEGLAEGRTYRRMTEDAEKNKGRKKTTNESKDA